MVDKINEIDKFIIYRKSNYGNDEYVKDYEKSVVTVTNEKSMAVQIKGKLLAVHLANKLTTEFGVPFNIEKIVNSEV